MGRVQGGSGGPYFNKLGKLAADSGNQAALTRRKEINPRINASTVENFKKVYIQVVKLTPRL
jgi:hypothetical protein